MPSSIFLPVDNHCTGDTKHHALIFFVCGNPGLIDFYDDFLRCLSAMIRASGVVDTAYDVYGQDLRGFHDDDHEPFGVAGRQPWDLEGQIEAVYADVSAQRRRDNGAAYDFVVMMGHSVGAYMTVEVFARHTKQGHSRAPHLTLRNGVLLFPTLTHIALSPSGRRMSAIESVPWLADRAHRVSGLVLSLFTAGMLAWILQQVMGFTEHAAEVTARWLKSRDGVWQAIHLGRSEMRTIREDEWEEDLWEVAVSADDDGPRVPRFFMYYGREDHWVSSRVRDEIMERKKGRARIVVDEGDVPHAFCTRERKSLHTIAGQRES